RASDSKPRRPASSLFLERTRLLPALSERDGQELASCFLIVFIFGAAECVVGHLHFRNVVYIDAAERALLVLRQGLARLLLGNDRGSNELSCVLALQILHLGQFLVVELVERVEF